MWSVILLHGANIILLESCRAFNRTEMGHWIYYTRTWNSIQFSWEIIIIYTFSEVIDPRHRYRYKYYISLFCRYSRQMRSEPAGVNAFCSDWFPDIFFMRSVFIRTTTHDCYRNQIHIKYICTGILMNEPNSSFFANSIDWRTRKLESGT